VQGAVALAAGALVALAVLLAWAAAHGTMPGPLWDATVTFRARAGLVLSAEAPSTDTHRWHVLLASFLLSGAPLVILAGLLPRRFHPGWPPRPRARSVPGPLDPRLLMLPLLAWELTAIALGGSYWLHYLIGLVPGLVVTSAAVTRTSLRRVGLVAAVLVWITLSTAVTDARTGGAPEAAPTEVAVQHYLRAHAAPGDTGVVAFGDAVLLQGAGLSSPYENLWSLPVKVRDPHLTRFTAVLESPHRPTWLVVAGASVGTWGVDSAAAQRAADRYYVPRRVIGEWHVFHARP
jgi:hypothetical protein